VLERFKQWGKVITYMVPFGNSTMVGEMEERGRAKGFMKFAGDGGKPNTFVVLGMLKSGGVSYDVCWFKMGTNAGVRIS